MPERYDLSAQDRHLLKAAAILLKKVAAVETLRPAELVSVAKLLHVLSVVPRVTPDLAVAVQVTGPRREFGEIETWHYWQVEVEGELLSISSGGHFYQPSTGGDSFTTMTWAAVPDSPTDFDDYRGTLQMVPDVQSFQDGVAGIHFISGEYEIEITDSDNALLDAEEETSADADEEPSDEEDPPLDADDDRSTETIDVGHASSVDHGVGWSVMPIDDAEKRLAAKIDPSLVDANEAQHAYNVKDCDFCGCPLSLRGLFVDGRLRGDLMWGNMCAACFTSRGEGVGWGNGQLYARQPDGRWRLVAGWN